MGIAFDDGAADALITAANSADEVLRAEGGFLNGAVERAVQDFIGGYGRLFTDACGIRSDDRGKLAGVLAALAEDVGEAKHRAQQEKTRQKNMEAWQQRDNIRKQHLLSGNIAEASATVATMVLDPMPESTPVPPPAVSAAFSARDRPRFAGGPGTGTTSADPGKLRGFASVSRTATNTLNSHFVAVRNAWSGFTASCSWVTIETESFVAGFERLLAANAADADWIEQVATAFETAGSGAIADSMLNGLFIQYAAPNQVGLNDIGTMSAAQLKVWLGNGGSARLRELLTQPGLDPVATATWWSGLGHTVEPATGKVTVGEEQQLLIDELPDVLGNLNGVTATARNLANRKKLLQMHDRWKKYRDEHGGKVDEGSQEGMVNKVWESLYDSEGRPKTNPQDPSDIRQLISFAPFGLGTGSETGFGASISVGDLDAAKHVSYQLPGLDTTIGKDVASKTKQAKDQRLDQRALASRNGIDPDRIAVVAWIGVEPAQGLGVFSNDQAKVVGPALRNDVTGFNAVHQNLENTARTTAVGHSMGSLGVMEAAKTGLPVDNLVLVGDVGAPDNVTSVNDLHLNPGGTVYRGTYDWDHIAKVGHGLGWQRRSTEDPGFGAVTFGTNGTTAPDGTVENPTKTHDGQTGGKDGVYGYFDRGTESSSNQAKIALGLSDQLTNVKR
ncbi:alpha/beta hydrolase [Paenarthrobacter sp. CCNWYY172]|uniref:alpha/beta hydrolase n=1 Tax=unclassified Paenarthrobacter TaxID=2634190 RepID=UPI0030788FDB